MMMDHVHMFAMIPPKYVILSVMEYIEGKSSLIFLINFPS